MEILLVTGQSGAGKTNAIRCLEDMGFFCMDNLPPAMLPGVVSMLSDVSVSKGATSDYKRIAVVIDIRSIDFLNEFSLVVEDVKKNNDLRILFLDAADEVLIKRFQETRRKHPLEKNRSLIQAISVERELLKPIKDIATYIIDTSLLTMKQHREIIYNIVNSDATGEDMSIAVFSFGFKHGIPRDADIMFDVRFLPNPFYDETMKYLTGEDQEVKDYVLGFEQSRVFIEKLTDTLEYLIPYYVTEDKNHLVIAIGCTGGNHRSVVIANEISDRLLEDGHSVYVEHRDIRRK